MMLASGMYYQIDGQSVRILGALHVFPPDASVNPAWMGDAYTGSKRIRTEHDTETFSSDLRAVNAAGALWATMLWALASGTACVKGVELLRTLASILGTRFRT